MSETVTTWEKWTTRIVSGLSLALMAALPVSLIPAIWTWDWRWVVSGAIASALGFVIGVVITESGRHNRKRTNAHQKAER